jgi:alpha-L-arabinofuranosidase
LDKIHAVSGYDEATGETIIKMVNATGEPFTTNVALNCAEVQKNGTVITLAAESLKAENSFDEPKKISPVTTSYNHFDKNFQYTFAPYSFTILRIKTSDK